MIIKTTKNFDKQYTRLSDRDKQRFKTRVAIFRQDPYAKILRNHSLKSQYLGHRSIDIAGGLRALYKVEKDVIIIFAFIGTHSQLYK